MSEATPDPAAWVPRADYDRAVAESAERFRELTVLEQQDRHHRDQLETLRVRFATQEARLGALEGILHEARHTIRHSPPQAGPATVLARVRGILDRKARP